MAATLGADGAFPGMDASLAWAGGLAFEATGMGGAGLRIDQPADEGGGGLGFKPLELLLHALAACMATTVVKILVKQRMAPAAYRVEVHGDRDAELPHPYTRIVLEHVFQGSSLRLAALERAVALVDEKYCSVSAILPRGLVENRVRTERETPVAETPVVETPVVETPRRVPIAAS
ncbi:MAG: OsmC family protein [Chloroflexi bacterium]|nr:OsmC family protein [Chloroflexota bacterium]